MGNVHSQYLAAMGIDLWQERGSRPAVAPVAAAEAAQPPPVAPAERAPAATSANGSGESPAAAIKRQLGGQQPAGKPEAPKIAPSEQTGPVPAGTEQKPQQPAFLMYFLRYPGFTVVVSLSHDAATLPVPHNLFLDGVYHAVTGQRQQSRVTEFRWPAVLAPHIDHPEADARIIIGQHLAESEGPVLLFGEAACRFVPAEPIAEGESGLVGDRPALALPSTDAYFEQPLRRRDLWRQLQVLRP